jgi:hypothetical protein
MLRFSKHSGPFFSNLLESQKNHLQEFPSVFGCGLEGKACASARIRRPNLLNGLNERRPAVLLLSSAHAREND